MARVAARLQGRTRARAMANSNYTNAHKASKEYAKHPDRAAALPVPLLSERLEHVLNESVHGGEKPSIARMHATSLQRAFLRHCLPAWSDASAETFKPSASSLTYNVPTKAIDLASGNNTPVVPISSSVIKEDVNARQDTRKLLIKLSDGLLVETVVMQHAYGRTTCCVSSQVGCRMACRFCATGKLGEIANLTGGEIVEQVLHACIHSGRSVTNVVFMGQGEPLNNVNAVREGVRMLVSHKLFSLSPRRVTVSTVGVAPGVEAMADDPDLMRVSLALSLHAPTQELRQKIVPSAGANRLERLLPACERLLDQKGEGSRLMIEYCVIGNMNDSDECARRLGDILPQHNCCFNLIPFNPSDSLDQSLQEPTEERLHAMMYILANEKGRFTTIRHEMGQDVDSACGQLSLTVSPEQQGTGPSIVDNDIEDSFAKQFEYLPRKARPKVKKRSRNAAYSEPVENRSENKARLPSTSDVADDANAQTNSTASWLERASRAGIGIASVGLILSACLGNV